MTGTDKKTAHIACWLTTMHLKKYAELAAMLPDLMQAAFHLEADALNCPCCIGLQVCTAVLQAADQNADALTLHDQCYSGFLIAHIQDDVGCLCCNRLADNTAKVLKDNLYALSPHLCPIVSAPGQNLQDLRAVKVIACVVMCK